MKLTGITAALLGCVAFVAAAPVRVTVEEARALPKYRIGLAGAHAVSHSSVEKKAVEHDEFRIHILPFPRIPSAPMPAKRPCAGKSVRISNWFRQVVGMPAIEHSPRPHHVIKFHSVPGPQSDNQEAQPHHRPHHRRPHPHHHFRYHLRKSFGQRLQAALMTLGPWEGRIVAFVLGCGIGVLLRLVWVMAVLVVRAFRRESQEEEDTEEDEEEVYLLPPPEYTDEKVALVAVPIAIPEREE